MTLLFAVAISVDAFVVGLTYGVKGIILPFRSTLIVSVTSGLTVFLSMLLGLFSTAIIDATFVNLIAVVLLTLMGLWRISTVWQKQNKHGSILASVLFFCSRLPLISYMVNVMREPEKAAGDNEEVDNKEAWLLGLVLAFDSIGGGFAIAMAGLSLLMTPVMVTVVSCILIMTAIMIGEKFRFFIFPEGKIKKNIEHFLDYFPGLIILLLALWKVFTI